MSNERLIHTVFLIRYTASNERFLASTIESLYPFTYIVYYAATNDDYYSGAKLLNRIAKIPASNTNTVRYCLIDAGTLLTSTIQFNATLRSDNVYYYPELRKDFITSRIMSFRYGGQVTLTDSLKPKVFPRPKCTSYAEHFVFTLRGEAEVAVRSIELAWLAVRYRRGGLCADSPTFIPSSPFPTRRTTNSTYDMAHLTRIDSSRVDVLQKIPTKSFNRVICVWATNSSRSESHADIDSRRVAAIKKLYGPLTGPLFTAESTPKIIRRSAASIHADTNNRRHKTALTPHAKSDIIDAIITDYHHCFTNHRFWKVFIRPHRWFFTSLALVSALGEKNISYSALGKTLIDDCIVNGGVLASIVIPHQVRCAIDLFATPNSFKDRVITTSTHGENVYFLLNSKQHMSIGKWSKKTEDTVVMSSMNLLYDANATYLLTINSDNLYTLFVYGRKQCIYSIRREHTLLTQHLVNNMPPLFIDEGIPRAVFKNTLYGTHTTLTYCLPDANRGLSYTIGVCAALVDHTLVHVIERYRLYRYKDMVTYRLYEVERGLSIPIVPTVDVIIAFTIKDDSVIFIHSYSISEYLISYLFNLE